MASLTRRRELNGRLIFLGRALNEAVEDCNIRELRHLLVEQHADPNVLLPELNYTPLHAVVASEKEGFAVEALKLMLQHNADPDVRAEEDLTPLHVAASWNRTQVARVLLDAGSCPMLVDELGKTALDYAKEFNNVEVLNVLVEHSERNSGASALIRRLRSFRLKEKKNVQPRNNAKCRNQQNVHKEDITHLSTLNENEDYSESSSVIGLTPSSTSASSHVSVPDQSDSQQSVVDDSEIIEVSSESSNNSTVPQSSSGISDLIFSESSANGAIPKTSTKLIERVSTSISSNSQITRCSSEDATSSESKDYGEMQGGRRLPYRNTSRRSVARASLMRPTSTPEIFITRPSIEVELTAEALAEHNLSTFLKPEDPSAIAKRIHCWISSTDFSPRAGSSTDETYHTCQSNPRVQEQLNTAGIESGLNHEMSDNSVKTCATVSECYQYTDNKEGIVLLEERWLANPVLLSDVPHTDRSSSSGILLTDPGTCDTDSLREELKAHGIHYGPVTTSTKKVYKQQLQKKKYLNVSTTKIGIEYSKELQKTFRSRGGMFFLSPGTELEKKVAAQFSKVDNNTRWREGNLKTSFTYLLLDPRITQNLPCRLARLPPREVWSTFLSSIFYIGKGKRSRPYSHLYEAMQKWKHNLRYVNSKVKLISEIWQEGLGVICLHVFQNVIPVEAYTREAAMIDAIGIQNLCNLKRSEYYGIATKWHMHEQRIFGVHLLYKALQIFLSEGERHLSPGDIM